MSLGVFETSNGLFRLVDDGDLPEAIAASCAIPYVFQPVMAGNPPTLMAGITYTHTYLHTRTYIHTSIHTYKH